MADRRALTGIARRGSLIESLDESTSMDPIASGGAPSTLDVAVSGNVQRSDEAGEGEGAASASSPLWAQGARGVNRLDHIFEMLSILETNDDNMLRRLETELLRVEASDDARDAHDMEREIDARILSGMSGLDQERQLILELGRGAVHPMNDRDRDREDLENMLNGSLQRDSSNSTRNRSQQQNSSHADPVGTMDLQQLLFALSDRNLASMMSGGSTNIMANGGGSRTGNNSVARGGAAAISLNGLSRGVLEQPSSSRQQARAANVVPSSTAAPITSGAERHEISVVPSRNSLVSHRSAAAAAVAAAAAAPEDDDLDNFGNDDDDEELAALMLPNGRDLSSTHIDVIHHALNSARQAMDITVAVSTATVEVRSRSRNRQELSDRGREISPSIQQEERRGSTATEPDRERDGDREQVEGYEGDRIERIAADEGAAARRRARNGRDQNDANHQEDPRVHEIMDILRVFSRSGVGAEELDEFVLQAVLQLQQGPRSDSHGSADDHVGNDQMRLYQECIAVVDDFLDVLVMMNEEAIEIEHDEDVSEHDHDENLDDNEVDNDQDYPDYLR